MEVQHCENVLQIPHKWCEPPPKHEACIALGPVKAEGLKPPYYGISDGLLKSLPVQFPLSPVTTRLFIKNLAYGVDEAKLHEVFSMSGRVVQATLIRRQDGRSKGQPIVEFAHPLEAI